MDTREFLESLTESALDDGLGWLTIWALSNKRSSHFTAAAAADEYAAKWRAETDLYYAPVLRRSDLGAKRRGGLGDLSVALAVWADVDVHVEGIHNDAALPPSKEAARQIVERMGRPPSIVVDSGNGIQALWLFSEPVEADDRLAELSRRWEATLQAEARSLGYGYDVGNWNLDRILRLPGTLNFKGDAPKEVSILSVDSVRYTVDDLEAVAIDVSLSAAAAAAGHPATFSAIQRDLETVGGAFTIRRDVDPPGAVLGMMEADPERVGASWILTRRFKSGDTSPSSYALSLATIAATAGWTNQQIADLLCAFHRRWKDKRDASYDSHRHGYQWFVRTIAKARSGGDEEAPTQPVDPIEVETIAGAEPNQKAAWLSEKFGFRFVRIDQQNRQETTRGNIAYYMVVDEESVEDALVLLGGENSLHEPRTIRNRIEAASVHTLSIPSELLAPRRWEAEIYPVLKTTVTLMSDESPVEQVRSLLAEYFTSHGSTASGSDVYSLREQRRPYVGGGAVWIHLSPFGGFVEAQGLRELRGRRLHRLLGAVGFSSRTVKTEAGSRSYYHAPIDSLAVPREVGVLRDFGEIPS